MPGVSEYLVLFIRVAAVAVRTLSQTVRIAYIRLPHTAVVDEENAAFAVYAPEPCFLRKQT